MNGALDAGGGAVGVLPGRLAKESTSREHRNLLLDKRLLLVSPWDPHSGFNIGLAMQRNKVIYGLAHAALVVEATPNKGGTWSGACDVYGADQQPHGTVDVEIRHSPIDLVRAEHTWTMTGSLERSLRYERTRFANRHTFDGPELYGNGIAYGRALYTMQHHASQAFKIRGREFFIDDDFTMAVAWKLYTGDAMTHIVFGPLTWHPDP